MKLFRRSLFAWIALLGIVFSQLAVSAYACPLLNSSNATEQMQAKGDMAGMPCAEMDMTANVEQPTLCIQHCDQGNQAMGSIPAPDFQPALVFLLTVPPLGLAEAPSETLVQAPLLARTTSPPPLWRSARLRI
ncbi:hypothetical protein [Polaromonas jejuensis]|uniref:Copper resistance protein n=1 Tax=Polaromonas jejuensis TaxID=457502 RepID=A0ABW0QBT7_9BURK|nr:hypothetical protein [Polaromonas jejuensis]